MEAVAVPPVRAHASARWAASRYPAILTASALVAITAGAAAVRAWGLGRQGFWYDEAMTSWLVRESPGHLLAALPHTESTPPLYYLIACGWVRLFGNTETGLRSLSAVAGTAVVPVAYLAARDLASRRAGLLAALLVAVNPLLVWYSQEARAYSLYVLAAGVSFWLFVRARAKPTDARLAAWVVAAAAALCTHYFAAFVVAAEALLLLARRGSRMYPRVAAVAIVAAAAGALGALAWSQRAHAHWQGSFPLRLRAEQIPAQLLAGFAPPATHLAIFLCAGAALAVVLLLVVRGSRRERVGAAVAGSVAAAVVVTPVLLALAGADYVNSRNALGAAVPLAVGLAICAAARRAWIAGVAAVAVLVAVSIALVVAVPHDAAAQRPDWRPVARLLAAPPGARRAILIRGSSSWALPLAHYLPHTWWAPPSGVRATEIEVLRKSSGGRSCENSSWWGANCSIKSRRPLGRAPARGFRLVAVRRAGGFSVSIYRARRPIRLYQRPPLERRHPIAAGSHRRKLLFTPRPTPRIP